MTDNERAIQNAEAEADHLSALARAAQAVIDAAVALNTDVAYDWSNCWVPEGRADDLHAAIDEWRALGGVTTEERA